MFKGMHFLSNVDMFCDINILLYMQRGIEKRIEEKENERDSFELQISNVNLSHIDERERNLVSVACSVMLFGSL